MNDIQISESTIAKFKLGGAVALRGLLDQSWIDATPPGPSSQICAFGCEPGDVIIFHPWALHTGYRSAPDQPRRTFTIRFLGDDIRWRPTTTYYHAWMADTGRRQGDRLEHEGFPEFFPASRASRSVPSR